MKFWVARDDYGLWLFVNEPVKTILYGDKYFIKRDNIRYSIDSNLFPEITFENSPQQVEISPFHSVQLTRDYFANHNWEIVIHDPDENGFILWEAEWKRSMEEGSPYYSDLIVTNMMHEDRFCVSGKTGEGSVEYLMAYTEEDLKNILKALAIYDFYEQEQNNSLL